MGAIYDRLGRGYAHRRRPDPRIARVLHAALGDARRVLDVGAGAGSYEPADRDVVAVEPSRVMIAQRMPDAAPVVRAVAGELPFADGVFDAAMAILTVHHWPDPARGLAELRRVARRIVVLTWQPEVSAAASWLVRDYLPEVAIAERDLATLAHVVAGLPGSAIEEVLVPHDCSDGFFGAYWRRPEAYLDADVRAAISGFARIDAAVLERALARLAADLASRRWHERHAELGARDALDLGYRLVVWPGS